MSLLFEKLRRIWICKEVDWNIMNLRLKLSLDKLHGVLAHYFAMPFPKISNHEDAVGHTFHDHSELAYCLLDPRVVKNGSSLPIHFLFTQRRDRSNTLIVGLYLLGVLFTCCLIADAMFCARHISVLGWWHKLRESYV